MSSKALPPLGGGNKFADLIFLIDTDYNVLLHNDRLPPEMNALGIARNTLYRKIKEYGISS